MVLFYTSKIGRQFLKAVFIPEIEFNKDFIAIIVGILGTTISPYFFGQATMEVEEMKHKKNYLVMNKKIINDMEQDVDFGMTFSGLVMFFIILTTGLYCLMLEFIKLIQ